MLTLTIAGKNLHFEHSLVSLREWEAEFEKPFFSEREEHKKTEEEMIRYFELMLVRPRKHVDLVGLIDEEKALALVEYMNSRRTATIVRDVKEKRGPQENVTAELIYYWLIAFNIPFQPTEEWHLNQLLTIVRVCSVKNAPAKPMTQSEKQKQVEDMRKRNEERRRQYGSQG